MIIKKYGDIPATYAPDVGEVVMARKSPVHDLVRAAVLGVRRIKSGDLKVHVQWLADGEHVKAGDQGWIVSGAWPPMIKQINKGQASDG